MKNLDDLRALPAEKLKKLAGVRTVPVYNIDGYFMKEQPAEVFAKGEQTKVPLLIGVPTWLRYVGMCKQH